MAIGTEANSSYTESEQSPFLVMRWTLSLDVAQLVEAVDITNFYGRLSTWPMTTTQRATVSTSTCSWCSYLVSELRVKPQGCYRPKTKTQLYETRNDDRKLRPIRISFSLFFGKSVEMVQKWRVMADSSRCIKLSNKTTNICRRSTFKTC